MRNALRRSEITSTAFETAVMDMVNRLNNGPTSCLSVALWTGDNGDVGGITVLDVYIVEHNGKKKERKTPLKAKFPNVRVSRFDYVSA